MSAAVMCQASRRRTRTMVALAQPVAHRLAGQAVCDALRLIVGVHFDLTAMGRDHDQASVRPSSRSRSMNSPFSSASSSDMVGWTTWESNSASNYSSVPSRSRPVQPHANNVVLCLVSNLAHRVQRVPVSIAFDPHLLSHGDAQSAERMCVGRTVFLMRSCKSFCDRRDFLTRTGCMAMTEFPSHGITRRGQTS